jgi:FkbM family methyltransferase
LNLNIKTPISYSPTRIFRLFLNRIIKSILKKNIKTNPQLVILSFDLIGLSINLDGRYENDQLMLLEQFIKDKMPNSYKHAAIDIGANIGNHSVFLSKLFRKVYSFEPNSITFDILSINSKYAAPKKNITTYNFGLSNRNDKLPITFKSTNIGGARIEDENYNVTSHDKRELINVKIADEIEALQEENISLIKIDIEGHELEALKGAEKIIKSNNPIILFEQGAEQIRNSSSEVIEYLSALNYSFYNAQKRFYLGKKFLPRLLQEILCLLFGDQWSFVETKYFSHDQYDMILAIHNDKPISG